MEINKLKGRNTFQNKQAGKIVATMKICRVDCICRGIRNAANKKKKNSASLCYSNFLTSFNQLFHF